MQSCKFLYVVDDTPALYAIKNDKLDRLKDMVVLDKFDPKPKDREGNTVGKIAE